MSTKTNTSVVLLPIQPRYASAIADGGKTVEFRKFKFKEAVSHIVIYSSSPIKKIIGYFSVSNIEEMAPQTLWRKYSEFGGIDHKSFKAYYENCEKGVAIPICNFSPLKAPQELTAINPELKAPQSFTYLSKKDFCKIQRLAIC